MNSSKCPNSWCFSCAPPWRVCRIKSKPRQLLTLVRRRFAGLRGRRSRAPTIGSTLPFPRRLPLPHLHPLTRAICHATLSAGERCLAAPGGPRNVPRSCDFNLLLPTIQREQSVGEESSVVIEDGFPIRESRTVSRKKNGIWGEERSPFLQILVVCGLDPRRVCPSNGFLMDFRLSCGFSRREHQATGGDQRHPAGTWLLLGDHSHLCLGPPCVSDLPWIVDYCQGGNPFRLWASSPHVSLGATCG